MATELATEFRGPGAQGSHLLLFAGVETNLYCIVFLALLSENVRLFVWLPLSLSGVVWRFCLSVVFLLRLPFSLSGVAVLFLCCFCR